MEYKNILFPPCSYQGGKQRISKNIINIMFENREFSSKIKFFDLCCGSGSVSLGLINNGFDPKNIFMIDSGLFGRFFSSISNNMFDIEKFQCFIKSIPDVEHIQNYLKTISNEKSDDNDIYKYLILQAGAFGSKQIYMENGVWKNCSFRNYWMPTEKSRRKSPVNPMMPMPKELYNRVENIYNSLSGKINAFYGKIEDYIDLINNTVRKGDIIYIDPPYNNTTKYGDSLDIDYVLKLINKEADIYVSESYSMKNAKNSYLISNGRKKGNITGNLNKNPVQEWLNLF